MQYPGVYGDGQGQDLASGLLLSRQNVLDMKHTWGEYPFTSAKGVLRFGKEF
jgi:hypothetical protein